MFTPKNLKLKNVIDNFDFGIKGNYDITSSNGQTYRNSDLTPKLSYNDGIFNANISKEILEGGDGLNLGAGVKFNDFYAKGDNLLSEDRNVLLGYEKTMGNRDGNFFFTGGAEKNLVDGDYTIGAGLKYKFADGGIAGLRQGYGLGGGINLGRRGFLKILGGTVGAIAAFKSGALKLLGKTATTKVAPKLFTAEVGSGAPAWFEGMVNKVLADGVDITKKAATMDGQTVKSLDTPTGKVDVTIDRTGNIDVNYQGTNTAMNEGVDMRYVVNEGDELTRGKPMDEFEAVETIPEGQMSSPNDYNVEFAENAATDVSGLYSDTSELEKLGGQNPLIKDISNSIKKKQTLKKMNENPDQFASDNLRDDFPNYDYDDVNPNYD